MTLLHRIFNVRSLLVTVICSYGWLTPAFASQAFRLTSPDGKTTVSIKAAKVLTYAVIHEKDTLLNYSTIALTLSDGTILGKNPVITNPKKQVVHETIPSPFYRSKQIVTAYDELNLSCKGGFGVIFRAYNDGVAYRFYTTFNKEVSIQNEQAEFNFCQDFTAYLPYTTNKKAPMAMAFQNTYDVTPLSKASQDLAFLPVTVACQHGKKLTILESDLESYPGMFVQAQPGRPALKGIFAQLPSKTDYYPWRRQLYITERGSNIAQTNGNRSYPWRILAISQKDIDMPVNNLVYALASSNRIGDVSWIKTGKVAWDWWNNWGLSVVNFKAGINMDTYKYYIDFASAHGIEFIVLDEGWYKPSSGDMLTTIPEINLPELMAYGKKKHVDIVLWTVFNVLDDQLEAACKKYSEMGIKGFKVDFLDRDDQTAVDMVYRIAACAAKYHLTLDFHGIYKPTGLNRTYPNVINFESVFGMEEAKWSMKEKDMPLYDVTFPYIRMMAGYVDFTPGAMRNATKNDFQPIYYNPMSMGTRCHQLGTYIVYDSPFTMLCDAPTNYEKEPAFTDFITSLPVDVDETKILSGEIGQYIISARKKSLQWYVGGLTNWDSRDVTVDFSFLGADEDYLATLYKDGVNADKQAEDYAVETFPVNKETKKTIHLASGGGFAIKLIRTFNQANTHPTAVPANSEFPSFYKKCLYADGIPVLSSANVSDEALLQAKQIIQYMLAKRKDIRDELVTKGCRVMIVGAKEAVCDLPEYAKICNTPENIAYWNRRARGFGGAPEDALSSSCGEENLICLPEDRYTGENILVHEFAHLFHTIGIVGLDPSFDKRLVQVMEHAKANGLWAKTYALTDKFEYFAEATQSFFSCNRYSDTPNGVHNGINRRSKLRDYDPEMYQLLSDYFEETDIPLCNVIHQ